MISVNPETRGIALGIKKVSAADVYCNDGVLAQYAMTKSTTETSYLVLAPDVPLTRIEHAIKASDLRPGDGITVLGKRATWKDNHSTIQIRVPAGHAPIKMTEAMFNSLDIRVSGPPQAAQVTAVRPLQLTGVNGAVSVGDDAEFDRVTKLTLAEMADSITAKQFIKLDIRESDDGKLDVKSITVYGPKPQQD